MFKAITPERSPSRRQISEMLTRLRLDGFVGGDHQQHDVDARGPGQHVADEALVARHVDEAETDAVLLQVSKAEVDADAAFLFFLQPVGVDSRQCAHK